MRDTPPLSDLTYVDLVSVGEQPAGPSDRRHVDDDRARLHAAREPAHLDTVNDGSSSEAAGQLDERCYGLALDELEDPGAPDGSVDADERDRVGNENDVPIEHRWVRAEVAGVLVAREVDARFIAAPACDRYVSCAGTRREAAGLPKELTGQIKRGPSVGARVSNLPQHVDKHFPQARQ